MIQQYSYPTEIGFLTFTSNGKEIVGIAYQETPHIEIAETDLIRKAYQEVIEYLHGKRTSFTFPMLMEGTAFQQDVWKAMQKVPYGETASYKDIAVAVGKPKAARAVGNACNKNPIAIVVPCHRIISAAGGFGGYAGMLDVKIRLLELEKENTSHD